MIISSVDNVKVKYLFKLIEKSAFRKKEKKFVVENYRIIKDNLDKCIEIYVTEEFLSKYTLETDNYNIITNKIANKLTKVVNSQGIFGLYNIFDYNIDILDKGGNVILLDNISDPGNLGTIIRTAVATNVNGIILSKNSCDVYMDKVIRSSMGGIFNIPIFIMDTFEAIEKLKKMKYQCLATSLKNSIDYNYISYNERTCFIMGNEANGLDIDILNLSDKNIKIPMENSIESLNLSIATSILMYDYYIKSKK